MTRRCRMLLALITALLLGFVLPGEATAAVAGPRGVSVTSLSPRDMAADVSAKSPLIIEFAGNVNPAFYQSVNVTMFHGPRTIDGELFYNQAAKQVMFKPKTPLQEGQTYTAQVTFANGSETSERVWSFRTGASGAAATTQSVSADPADQPTSVQSAGTTGAGIPRNGSGLLSIANANMGSGELPAGSNLEVSFSEPLELGTLREAPIKVYQGRNPIGIDYRLSRDLKTITLVPRSTLKPGMEYSVAITTALAGASGSRLSKTTLIPFRIAGQNSSADYEVPQHVLEEAPPEPGDTSFDAAPGAAIPAARTAPTYAAQSFSAPAVPLKVVAMTPRQGEVVTNLSQPISIVFNQDVRPETLNEFTFRVEDDFGPVPAKIRYIPERRQGVLTPVGVLDLQKTYRVIVTQGVSDAAGGRLAKGISSSFSTQSAVNAPSTPEMFTMNEPAPAPVRKTAARQAPAGRGLVPESFPMTAARPSPQATRRAAPKVDPRRESRELEVIDDETDQMSASANMDEAYEEQPRAAPARKTGVRKAREALSTFKITGISPSANAENVKRDSRITLQFSDPVNPSTLDEVNISVFANQRRVEGRVSYDSRQQRAVFIPSEPFDAETNYKVRISDKIRSAIGEPLMGKYSWEFTTGTERRPAYVPRGGMEADAAFSIPLADRRSVAARSTVDIGGGSSTGSSFTYISPKHWAFKSIKHMHSKGLLVTYPFTNKDRVTRYECAMSVNTILSTLKSLQNRPTPTQLRVADLVELEHLVIEFRPELKSLRTNPAWFEQFLQNQGVNLAEIQARVAGRNRG